MKTLQHKVDDYSVFAYIDKANHPEGYYSLKITSQWETAKDPLAEQTKFTMLLSPSAIEEFKKIFSEL